MHKNFKELTDKYEDGYRCIHEDRTNGCTYTLRDFKKGKICTVSTNNRMEIGEIDHFLDELKALKKKTGHDCFCTGCETDE